MMKSCSLILLPIVRARDFLGVVKPGLRRVGFVGEESVIVASGEFASGSGEERSSESGA